jgi:L-ascorbate 6-phosphate lactonase
MRAHTPSSDWGDWLPTAVADATVEGVSLWYLGCNGFVLKAGDGTTLFIDPYFGLGTPPRTVRMIPVPMEPADVTDADALLATHEHSDHVDGPSQAPILAGTGATMYGTDDSIERTVEEGWTDRWECTDGQFETVSEGDHLEVGSLDVFVEAAHDPLATHPVSYVIRHEAGTFFHGGDTRHDPDILDDIGRRYDVDLGVIAFGSNGLITDKETGESRYRDWYCDGNEAVSVANALRMDRLVPTHWDMWKGLRADPRTLFDHARSMAYPRDVEVAVVGDRVEL